MRITIKPDPVVIGTINAEIFKTALQADFDLQQAINKSISITINKTTITTQDIINYITWQLDWGDLTREIHNQPDKKIINFKILEIHNTNRKVYDIGTTDTLNFQFKEVPSLEVEGIIIQDLIPQINYALATNLSKTTFAFTTKKWQPTINIQTER